MLPALLRVGGGAGKDPEEHPRDVGAAGGVGGGVAEEVAGGVAGRDAGVVGRDAGVVGRYGGNFDGDNDGKL